MRIRPRGPLSREAQRLHQESLVVLTHDHIPPHPANRRAMATGGVTVKVYHIVADVLLFEDGGAWRPWSARITDGRGWARWALRALEDIWEEEERLGTPLIARSADDILAAKRDGRQVVIIGAEGAKLLESDPAMLAVWHRLGLRHLQVMWAAHNGVVEKGRGRHAPLSALGREIVREADRLGVVLDIGHMPQISIAACLELCELSKQPVVAGHHGVRAISQPYGELTDELLEAIARTDGVVGLHFMSHLVRRGRSHSIPDPPATLDELIDHVEYIRDRVGIRHVALGPDFLADSRERQEAFLLHHGDPITWVGGIDRVSKIPRVTEGLLARRYSWEEIRGVLGGNYMRVFRTVTEGATDGKPRRRRRLS